MTAKISSYALTFDDVLLLPKKSNVKLNEIDVTARLTKEMNIHIPMLSAAMDTVTESATAIAMAREGGMRLQNGGNRALSHFLSPRLRF